LAPSASVGRVAWLLLALAGVGACGGKAIHLGNSRDGGACTPGQVAANEVLFIGDTWVLIPGAGQHARVADLALRAGAIGAGESYVLGAMAANTMAMIADQYAAREAGATKVKAVIMDGGTWETIVAMNSGASVSDAANEAAAAFGDFLAQVANDGTVQDVVYFLVPEAAGIPGVAALRPLLKQACDTSAVRCHFLDLQSVWAGHADYSVPGAVPIPTEAGAVAIAAAIWSLMQQECVAQ
jgi:hypothetical protein